jgi:hypothetical protein
MVETNTTVGSDKNPEIERHEEIHTTKDVTVVENGNESPIITEKDTRFSSINRRKLYRKVDMWVVPVTTILYLFSFIDRANIVSYPLSG